MSAPRVAPADAAQRQPAAPPRAIFLDGLRRVRRASGLVAAASGCKWGNQVAVHPNEPEQQVAEEKVHGLNTEQKSVAAEYAESKDFRTKERLRHACWTFYKIFPRLEN